MKKILLTCFFGLYHIFMPFVLVNCGEDIPYNRLAESGKEDEESGEKVDCEQNEFLTADCVDEVSSGLAADQAVTGDEEGTFDEEAEDDEEGDDEWD